MNQLPRWVIPAVIAVSIAVVAIAFAVRAARIARQRAAELKAFAERLGLSVMDKGDKAFVKAWSVIKPLKSSGKATSILYGGLPSGRGFTAFSHTYIVSTGKSAHAVTHTVAAYDCPAWPSISFQRRNAIAAAVRSMFKKPNPADTGAVFESDWLIESGDAGWKAAVLTPDVMTMLSTMPKAFAGLWVHEGKLVTLYSGNFTVERLEEAVAALESFMAALEQRTGSDGSDTHDPHALIS